MPRWEPNAGERLRVAALELFVERGYEQTTVADIADRAGLTARTFFRYYADKREVLFAGSEELLAAIVAAVDDAPVGAATLDVVGDGLAAAGTMLGRRRDFSARRQLVIDATAELRERELIKLATMSTSFADGLVRRGVEPDEAALAGEAGVAVLRVAFARWAAGQGPDDLVEAMRAGVDALRSLAAR